MNPKTPKLQQQQKEESVAQTGQEQTAHEFESVDEMLRHDAERTGPPHALAHRVADSIAREPKPARSWWRRLLSRG